MSWIKKLAIEKYGEDGFQEYLDYMNEYGIEPEEIENGRNV